MVTPAHTTIVVPCFNEAKRLQVEVFRAFATAHPSVRFLFVNDGSTDDTRILLDNLAEREPEHFEQLEFTINIGKAEAVRVGMLRAFEIGSVYAGYWDADLATPLDEIPRFIQALDTYPQRDICFGSRVQLLGRHIERSALRHYLGRLFATIASTVLELPVYDTQCGAKLFRVSPTTKALFEERFCVNWTFDVELIARLKRNCHAQGKPGPASLIYELPLDRWQDVAGSKVRPRDFVKALAEMLRIRRKYLRT